MRQTVPIFTMLRDLPSLNKLTSNVYMSETQFLIHNQHDEHTHKHTHI